MGRWESQGLAWVDALDWQKRALRAEKRVGQVAARLAELDKQVSEISSRDKCMLALEQKVERLDSVLRRLEQGVATKASVVGLQDSVDVVVDAILSRLGGGIVISKSEVGDIDDCDAADQLVPSSDRLETSAVCISPARTSLGRVQSSVHSSLTTPVPNYSCSRPADQRSDAQSGGAAKVNALATSGGGDLGAGDAVAKKGSVHDAALAHSEHATKSKLEFGPD